MASSARIDRGDQPQSVETSLAEHTLAGEAGEDLFSSLESQEPRKRLEEEANADFVDSRRRRRWVEQRGNRA